MGVKMAIQYATEENFEQLIGEGFVIVDFYSTTCGPCKMFSKILEDMEAEIPFLNIVKINTTDYPSVGEKYKIRAVPTIHFYKDGELKKTNIGVMQPVQVKEIISEYMYL
jgi:thioredoxin 1